MSLVDPLGRHYDMGTVEWIRSGPPGDRVWVLNCRHARTVSRDRTTDTEGVMLSRLIEEHQAKANISEESVKGNWLCFCEPHRRPQ